MSRTPEAAPERERSFGGRFGSSGNGREQTRFPKEERDGGDDPPADTHEKAAGRPGEIGPPFEPGSETTA